MTAGPDAPRAPEVAAQNALPAPTPAWWRKHPLVIAVAAAVVGAAGIAIGISATSGPGTITVHGTIELTALQYGDSTNPSSPVDGDSCAGFGASSDIAPGLTVTVEGSSGQSLGSGLLQAGVMQDVGPVDGLQEGLCTMPFTVTVPSGQSQYAVAIAGHGAQEYSRAQLQKGVALTLG